MNCISILDIAAICAGMCFGSFIGNLLSAYYAASKKKKKKTYWVNMYWGEPDSNMQIRAGSTFDDKESAMTFGKGKGYIGAFPINIIEDFDRSE